MDTGRCSLLDRNIRITSVYTSKGRRTITEGNDKGTYFDGTFTANGETKQGAWYDKNGNLIAKVP